MPWLDNGDAKCDSCPQQRVGHLNRALAIQMLRAGNWRHMIGKTLGGVPFETILCRDCAHHEHKRTRKDNDLQQDALPFDWEEFRRVERKQGA